MHLDINGLPTQADGDANDQLQRVGTILSIGELAGKVSWPIRDRCYEAAFTVLQPRPGAYVRSPGNSTDNVSADQLISILAFWILDSRSYQAGLMFFRMCLRLGFAQNYKDGLNDSKRFKLPDFMALRALPLFARTHWCLYPATILCDVFLTIAAVAAVGPVFRDDSLLPQKRSPDDVDYNVIILTLVVCRAKMVTPLSYLAAKIFARYCANNLGSGENVSNVQGALNHYHRVEAGGNPEIALMWEPIVKKYLS